MKSVTPSTKLTHMFSSFRSSTPWQLNGISSISDSVETLLHYQIRDTRSFPQMNHNIHQSHLAKRLKSWRKKSSVTCRTFFWELWYSLLSLLVSSSGGVAVGEKIGGVAEGSQKLLVTSHWEIVLTILLTILLYLWVMMGNPVMGKLHNCSLDSYIEWIHDCCFYLSLLLAVMRIIYPTSIFIVAERYVFVWTHL